MARTSQLRRVVVARSKPDAVTSVEITWAIPSRPPAMPGEVTATLLGLGIRPSRPAIPAADFSTLTCVLDRELSLQHATKLVEREARRVTGSALALCVFFDWTQRRAWTMQGHYLTEAFDELIAEVAGSGHAAVSRHAIIEPIGRVPTRTVLVTRRDDEPYRHEDYAIVAALGRAIDAPFDRLLRATTGRP